MPQLAKLRGLALLRSPLLNKGTAFTADERAVLGLEGFLPPRVETLDEQVTRAWAQIEAEPTPICKYQALRGLQERQEVLFHAVLARHLDELLPVVYTPTVGDAVRDFSALWQHPRGVTLTPDTIDHADAILADVPQDDVRMIVATDSSAILGIGDQGWGGLGIPIGKLALYTVAGGIAPHQTLPVVLDVGTDRGDLLEDPAYLGVRRRRLRGEAYAAVLDRFVAAVRARWPRAVLQWEDLAKDAAFTALERHRAALPSFNDDIQGTGAMALAGVLSACRLAGTRLADQKIVIHGAGAGGIGVAWALAQGLMAEGLSAAAALERLWVLDSRGLLRAGADMEAYKRPFARAATRPMQLTGARVRRVHHPRAGRAAPDRLPALQPDPQHRGAARRHHGLDRRPRPDRDRQPVPGGGAGQQRLHLPRARPRRRARRRAHHHRRHGPRGRARARRAHRARRRPGLPGGVRAGRGGGEGGGAGHAARRARGGR
jgi:malate dehydrogenase (oxaloacetate-decarboxylating)